LEFGVFLALLKSHWWIRFKRFYFTILKVKVWKILIFEWICCWKFKKIAKIRFGRKNQLSLLLNLEIFNYESLKNERCVHTWTNGASYMSIDDNGLFEVQWCQLHERYHHNWSFPNILCQHQGIMGLITKPGEYGWASC
jgi:hypothetical protein